MGGRRYDSGLSELRGFAQLCNEREEALACFREAYGYEVKKNGEDSEMAQKLLQYISVVES